MNSGNQPASTPSAMSSRRLLLIWLFILVALALGVLVYRNQAVDGDFANANIFTYVGMLLGWLITVAFSWFAVNRRLWKLALLLPLVLIGLFFTIFRFERVDGELQPIFALRWAQGRALPALNNSVNSSEPALQTDFQPRSTDSPQFLGPSRNASWPDQFLEGDWTVSQPEILWKQSIGEGWSSFAVVGDVGVTMEQRDDQEWISAYDVVSGKLLWKHVIDQRYASPIAGNGPRSTPAIQGDRVFACSAISPMVCLNLADGKLVWSQDLNQLAGTEWSAFEIEVNWGRSGSPLLYQNSVIVPLGGHSDQCHSLIAFDQQTGGELWRAGTDQVSYSSPTLLNFGGQDQMVFVSSRSLSAFEPASGKPLWTVDFPGISGQPNVAQPIQLDDQRLFFSKGYGIGSRIFRITPPQANSTDSAAGSWKATLETENRTVLRTKFTNPVYFEGHLYGLSDGILECIAADTLERKWKRGRYHQGQLLLLGNRLLVSAEDGRLILVKPDSNQHQELGELPIIGDVSWNIPTLSGDRLLVRNSTEAACLKIRLGSSQLD